MSSTRLLIDGDILVFSLACACETNIDWGDDIWSCQVDVREASQRADIQLNHWLNLLSADSVMLAFSDPNANWRKEVLPTYKSNRKGRKPTGFAGLREYIRSTYQTLTINTLEGDDVLGLEAGLDTKGKRIVVSSDKDLRSIPGLLFNPDKPDLGVMDISQEEADNFFYTQVLTGDRTDGYSGCPGVGPKTAEKILADAPNPWKEVVKVYEKAGLSEEVALTQARVARILRPGEYDYKKEEVILWCPPIS